jgi:DNA/RNA endonuclease G (NUC1)
MNKDRRLAFVSAVNIDGPKKVDIRRGNEDFILDNRMEEGYQIDNELYVRNPLDRGHLTRRQDPVWGTFQEAQVRGAGGGGAHAGERGQGGQGGVARHMQL